MKRINADDLYVVSCLVLLWATSIPLIDSTAVQGKGEPLFAPDHPNITYLTDANFDALVMNDKKNTKPWLIDFYHPFCPHCKAFVPDWTTIAAYYKTKGTINIGALSCMDHVKCRRVAINGFPSLIAYNFNPKQQGESSRIIGTHTVLEVKDFVKKMTKEGADNATNWEEIQAREHAAELRAGEVKPVTIWEETTEVSTGVSRLRDAASAFMFGLKQGIFTGREVLDDLHLDALKEWLRIVSLTFPGSFNRQMIGDLYDTVSPLTYLHVDVWDPLVEKWQNNTLDRYDELELERYDHIPEWQKQRDLFDRDGNDYEKCGLYTCGQWTMFHMMAVNPIKSSRSDETLVGVLAAIRRFMKHFFGCVQCRTHFLQANTMNIVTAVHNHPNKTRALEVWVWKFHNAVNKRLGHPQWPKEGYCDDCGDENTKWKEGNVMRWLRKRYGYVEVDINDAWWPSLRSNAIKIKKGAQGYVDKTVTAVGADGVSSYSMTFFVPTLAVILFLVFVMRPRMQRNVKRNFRKD